MAPRKSSDPLSDRLRELLRNLGVPRDDLPYTDQFDSLKAQLESDSGDRFTGGVLAAAINRRQEKWRRGNGAARGSPAPRLTAPSSSSCWGFFPRHWESRSASLHETL